MPDGGSPREVSVLETLPFIPSFGGAGHGVVFGNRAALRHAVLNATQLLRSRVDPVVAAMDQAIPTWVIEKAHGIAFMWVCKVRRSRPLRTAALRLQRRPSPASLTLAPGGLHRHRVGGQRDRGASRARGCAAGS